MESAPRACNPHATRQWVYQSANPLSRNAIEGGGGVLRLAARWVGATIVWRQCSRAALPRSQPSQQRSELGGADTRACQDQEIPEPRGPECLLLSWGGRRDTE